MALYHSEKIGGGTWTEIVRQSGTVTKDNTNGYYRLPQKTFNRNLIEKYNEFLLVLCTGSSDNLISRKCSFATKNLADVLMVASHEGIDRIDATYWIQVPFDKSEPYIWSSCSQPNKYMCGILYGR